MKDISTYTKEFSEVLVAFAKKHELSAEHINALYDLVKALNLWHSVENFNLPERKKE